MEVVGGRNDGKEHDQGAAEGEQALPRREPMLGMAGGTPQPIGRKYEQDPDKI